MKANSVVHSSKTDEWGTPRDLYERLNRKFKFTLDPCTTKDNPLGTENYMTIEEDGLSIEWTGHTVFMNPPYSNAYEWVWYASHQRFHALTVCLLASRTDTKWWHEFVKPHALSVEFIKGRLKFVGGKHSAPFPSCIVIF